jgi:signal transduction histidine kinase
MHTEIATACELPTTMSVISIEPVPAGQPAAVSPLPVIDRPPSQRSRIRHDIQHEVATLMLLAEVVAESTDVGSASRNRLLQLSREASWLDQLLAAYDDVTTLTRSEEWKPPADAVRVDVLVGEVVSALSITHASEVHLSVQPAWTCANRLTFWRALRNLLDNAFRAAGERGRIDVVVRVEADTVYIDINDDGPGFGHGPKGFASLGLGIVQDFAVERGGRMEVGRGLHGGTCARLVLPALFDEWEEYPQTEAV